MKTILKTLIVILFIGIPFSSCDSVESLADVEFTSNLSADLNVTVPPMGALKATRVEEVSFSGQATINPRADQNIEKYFDMLKSFEVQSLTATFNKVSKPVMIKSGTISIYEGSNSASWSVTNFNVTNGASLTLDTAHGEWTIINKILKGKKTFTAKIAGAVDDDDVSFTVTILIKVKVVANPLK